MRITQLLNAKQNGLAENPVPTVAFLGDSVTQGCFELLPRPNGGFDAVFDGESVYHRILAARLSVLYPDAPVNILNAGVSGDGTELGLRRLERDVLRYHPDLTVVCFGLNDCHGGDAGIARYRTELGEIFRRLRENGSEIIFMTPNMMNTKISNRLSAPDLRAIAEKCMHLQQDGVLTRYLDAGRAVAAECGVPVCDIYARWQAMARGGVDTTALLANGINHPTRQMHALFADSLLEVFFSEGVTDEGCGR